MTDVAINRIGRLRMGLTAALDQAPAVADTLDGHFDPMIRYPALTQALQEFSNSLDCRPRTAAEANVSSVDSEVRSPVIIVPQRETPDLWDSIKLESEIWRDRLNVMNRTAVAKEMTMAAQIATFLQVKEDEAGAKNVSVSRLYALRLHLTGFADWLGGDTPVDKIRGQDLVSYRSHLLKLVAETKLAPTTAGDRLSSVKSFVRWLWQTEAITDLPRVLHPRSKLLEIGKAVQKILTHTESEIATLVGQASERTRLYILLMLNTAMTQKDISDLLHEEVDWEHGRIIRKRSKTKKSGNVPTVSYLLWPETVKLLKKHCSPGGTGRVLLNVRGEPLLTERFGDDGKYWKMDNVRNAFDRLRRKTKIDKPFKCLKKTSASLLRESERFNGVVGLFLGHAPRQVSEKFYAAAPQKLLDQAIVWLHDHYLACKCFDFSNSE